MKHFMKVCAIVALLFSFVHSAEWNTGVYYSEGDEVTYDSKTWVCTFFHRSSEYRSPGAPGNWFWEETSGSSSGGETPTAGGVVVYSKTQTSIGSMCEITTGDVLSDNDVYISSQSTVKGDVISGRDIHLGFYTHVEGDVVYVRNYDPQNGVIVDGGVYGDAYYVAMELEELDVPVGSENVFVSSYSSRTLEPGDYHDLSLGFKSKLYLSGGVYNFRKFTTDNYSKVYIDIAGNEDIEMYVRDYMEFDVGTKFNLTNADNPSAVHIYSDQSSVLEVGSYSNINGILTAPNAEIDLGYDVSWTGALYGNKVTLNSHSSINGVFAKDSDDDGVPDVVEYEAGTDPYDYDSKPAVLVSGSWANLTGLQSQELVYDFSHFPGYEHLTNVPVYLPYGSVEGQFTVLYTVEEVPVEERDNDYVTSGSLIRFHGGTLQAGIQAMIPVYDPYRGIPIEHLELVDDATSQPITIDKVTYSTVYADLGTTTEYSLSRLKHTYRVSMDFANAEVDEDPWDFKYLNEAFEAISLAKVDGVCPKSIVYVAKGTYKPNDQGDGGTGKFTHVFRH